MLNRREFIEGTAAALAIPSLHPLLSFAAETKGVRITDVETFYVRVPGEDDSFLVNSTYGVTRVHTDAGVTGTAFLPCPQDVLERWVKPVLIGENLFAIDPLMKRLQAQRGESFVQSWSGVEHAMWDAVGRIANLPVAKLLGGARDKLRVYRTCVFPYTAARAATHPLLETDESDISYDEQAKYAVRLKENGFMGMKCRAWRPRPMDDVDAVGVIRAAVGPDFKIMLDRTAVRPGSVWDYETALKVCRGLEKYDTFWLEEPFDGHDIYGPARLAAQVDILITGGELGKSLYEFLEFLVNKTYDVVQPDTRICGGIWAARKIAVIADVFGVPCIQHGTSSLALAGYIQAGCAMSNCEWQEIIGGPNLPQEQWAPARKLVRTSDVFTIENGYILLPDLPGLGLDINEDALKEYRVHA